MDVRERVGFKLQRLRREKGLSQEDASDLAQLAKDSEDDEPDLEALRTSRAQVAAALETGLCGRHLPALLLLAERAGARGEASIGRLTAELLADAALLSSGASDFMRHKALAGKLAEIARKGSPGNLRRSALLAADPPPDNRRGNKRLHYEQLLLELYLSGS